MILEEGQLKFDFSTALNVFKFDDGDKNSPNYHGLSHCMKAVDFIAEYDEYYLFVEVKDPPNYSHYESADERKQLLNTLVTKFRDTFLYRWAENKIDKPIKYFCLVELDNAQISYLMKELKLKLPAVGVARWQKPLVQTCIVANIARWNANFPHIPVQRI